MRVHNEKFDAFLDEFTPNTYIMVIIADPEVCMLSLQEKKEPCVICSIRLCLFLFFSIFSSLFVCFLGWIHQIYLYYGHYRWSWSLYVKSSQAQETKEKIFVFYSSPLFCSFFYSLRFLFHVPFVFSCFFFFLVFFSFLYSLSSFFFHFLFSFLFFWFFLLLVFFLVFFSWLF